jgi:hypothetical protein
MKNGWLIYSFFFVDVTVHLNTLNKGLQGKDKLITEISASIKAFKVTFRL